MGNKILFKVSTVLNVTIRTTERYWQKVCKKHPRIRGMDKEVQNTLKILKLYVKVKKIRMFTFISEH